jgi:thioredoxin reductase (NADPH)
MDVIIVGGGPAGLTAGIYTQREGFSTLLLEKGYCAGLLVNIDLIENYPGFPQGIKGIDLINKFKEQALKFGVNIVEFEEVKLIQPNEKQIKVKTYKGEYIAYAVIVASGSTPKKLNIPGEEKYTGRGVSYCALCDGPLFREKRIIVVGGGDAAVSEALFLTKFASKVILIHRRDELKATKLLQEKLKDNKKVELLLGYTLSSIEGNNNQVNSVMVKNLKTGKEERIEDISGVFIYIGFLPNSSFLKGVVKMDDNGYILTNEKMETSYLGIYAVGDVRKKDIRQIITACSDAVIASVSLRDYIKKLK